MHEDTAAHRPPPRKVCGRLEPLLRRNPLQPQQSPAGDEELHHSLVRGRGRGRGAGTGTGTGTGRVRVRVRELHHDPALQCDLEHGLERYARRRAHAQGRAATRGGAQG